MTTRSLCATLSLALTVPACTTDGGTPDPDEVLADVSAELADALADPTVRRAIADRIADGDDGNHEVSLRVVRDVELDDGTSLGEALDAAAGGSLPPGLALIARDGIAAWADTPPAVTFVADATIDRITVFAAGGLIAVHALDELPSRPLVVLHPEQLANLPSDVPAEPVMADATLSVWLRDMRIFNDHETGTDPEIKIRCKEGNAAWKTTTDLEYVDEESHYYYFYDEKIVTTALTINLMCEVFEYDGWQSSQTLGSLQFSPAALGSTSASMCAVAWIDEAELAISQSRGANLCPELWYLGMSCPQHCADWYSIQ